MKGQKRVSNPFWSLPAPCSVGELSLKIWIMLWGHLLNQDTHSNTVCAVKVGMTVYRRDRNKFSIAEEVGSYSRLCKTHAGICLHVSIFWWKYHFKNFLLFPIHRALFSPALVGLHSCLGGHWETIPVNWSEAFKNPYQKKHKPTPASELMGPTYVSKVILLPVQSLCVELVPTSPAWIQLGDPGVGSHHVV